MFFAFCLLPKMGEAQEITIIDKLTQQYIPGAKIWSKNPSIQKLASNKGRFQLNDFYAADSIYISYTSYGVEKYAVNDLKNKVWVELSDEHIAIHEMVVTANRWEQDKSKLPNRIQRIDVKQIPFHSPQTAADLLESSGYVFIQKSQFAGGSPQIRGFGTNRVLIVVDGIRMNNAIFRSGNLQNIISIDANSLEGAEVLFGPGAVVYGSDAIGGIMDFSTKKAMLSTDSIAKNLKTNVYSRYSSSANELTNHIDFSIGGQKLASTTAISYSKFGDLKTGKYGPEAFLRPSYQTGDVINPSTIINPNPRIQVGSEYSQLNLLQKIIYQPTKYLQLEYGMIIAESSNANRYDRLIQDIDGDLILDYSTWYYGPQKWMLHKIALNYTKPTLLFDNAKMIIAYQNQQESRHDAKITTSKIRRQFEDVKAFSFNANFDKTLGSSTTLYYGTEYVFNLVNSNAYKESTDGTQSIINSRYPDGSTWKTGGVFFNIEHQINEKLIAHLGGRFTIYEINADFDTTLFAFPVTNTKNENNALNGSLGLVYTPNPTSQYYLNTSTGFRAPNIDDLGKVFDSEPGFVVVPNTNLKPEYAYNAEIGFMNSFKNRLKLDGAIYYTYLDNALARNNFQLDGADSILYEGQMSKVQAIQNISNAYVYGAQAGLELIIYKGLSLLSTINYQKGFDFDNTSKSYFPKTHIAPLFGRTTIQYKRRQFQIACYMVYQAEMKFEDLPLIERDEIIYAKDENGNNHTPGWYTLNVKSSYFFNKHLSLNAGIENITNQRYRTFGSGISSPGTNFIISLKGTF